MAESVQNWRKKWFYIKDKKVGEQKFGFAPFDPTKQVKKLKSGYQPLTEAELEETEPLLARIQALQTDEGKELSGLQIMAHFLRLRIRPLQARASPMWTFSGPKDPTRVSKENLSTNELEKLARQLTTLTAEDNIPSSCRVAPFDKKHPPPAGHIFLFCLPPLPEEGEVPEVAADAEGETPEAAVGQEIAQTNEDEASQSAHTETSIPPTNSQDEGAKGKRKRSEADEDSESSSASKPQLIVPISLAAPAPSSAPSLFDLAEIPIAREMMDMAIRYIGFRDEASELSAALKKSEKHAEELEAKLKSAEETLEDARAQATTKEEEWEEKSKMATREADIRQRLEALNASFIKKVGDSYEMPGDQRTDPLLDSLTILDANSVRVRNVLVRARRAFKRLFGNFFPKQKEPKDLLDLADVFNAEQDPSLDYH
ncbi:hypothetical protein ACQ4PT_000883 [Festuca glaucescens]